MEQPLSGGRTAGVVRVGDTVRRPARPNVGEIHDALRYLRDHGAAWTPEVLGIDDDGREVLRWAPGEPTWVRHRRYWGENEDMARIGRVVRELHDLFAAHPTADGDRLLTHGDLGPWNVVASEVGQLVIIDWDGLAVRPWLWEVAHAAWAFVPLMDRNETDAIGWREVPLDHASRLDAFCRGYGLLRTAIPGLLDAIVEASSKAAEDDADGGEGTDANRAFIARSRDTWSERLDAILA